MSRTVGEPKNIQIPWQIENPSKLGGRRGAGGRWEPNLVPGFFPKSIRSPFHPCGNSVGYALQFAHIFGASKVLLLGCTGSATGGYDFGDINPATRKKPQRDTRRIEPYLRWVEKVKPGWAKLAPGLDGPWYSILQTEVAQNVDAPWA